MKLDTVHEKMFFETTIIAEFVESSLQQDAGSTNFYQQPNIWQQNDTKISNINDDNNIQNKQIPDDNNLDYSQDSKNYFENVDYDNNANAYEPNEFGEYSSPIFDLMDNVFETPPHSIDIMSISQATESAAVNGNILSPTNGDLPKKEFIDNTDMSVSPEVSKLNSTNVINYNNTNNNNNESVTDNSEGQNRLQTFSFPQKELLKKNLKPKYHQPSHVHKVEKHKSQTSKNSPIQQINTKPTTINKRMTIQHHHDDIARHQPRASSSTSKNKLKSSQSNPSSTQSSDNNNNNENTTNTTTSTSSSSSTTKYTITNFSSKPSNVNSKPVKIVDSSQLVTPPVDCTFSISPSFPTLVVKNQIIKPYPTVELTRDGKVLADNIPTSITMYYADVFLVTSDDRSFTLSGTTRTNFAEDGKAAFKMLRSTALSSKYGASKFRLRFEVQKDDGLNLNPILLISSEFPIVAKVPKDSKLILEKLVPNKVPSDVSTEVAILGYFPTSPNAVLEVRLCQDGEDVESSQSIRCERAGRGLYFVTPCLNLTETQRFWVYIYCNGVCGPKPKDLMLIPRAQFYDEDWSEPQLLSANLLQSDLPTTSNEECTSEEC
eukprot:TRINITY_DN654_c1_g1_i8.p1 TRINITY_DN654_c1_g1~~TRINITY_DN654_c1_g1_i8.p1  ORF type:complete len:603 (+),score=149.66 TRINITY_DN654_c1_g1_i8:234-2042(+)